MLNRRKKAAIGYATYLVATRVIRVMVHRKAQEMAKSAQEEPRPRRRRVIPLVGGAAALAGVAALAARRRPTDTP